MLPSLVRSDIIDVLVKTASNVPDGNFIEVGVYQGGTAWHLAKLAEKQNREIYLYDTFTGIPYQDEVDYHKVGDFGDTDYITIKNAIPYATVIQGVFPDSAVEMGPISFAHLDCDQYRAVKNSVEYLLPKMVKGGIIWFDDYSLNGAKKAIHELFGDKIFHSIVDRVYTIIE